TREPGDCSVILETTTRTTPFEPRFTVPVAQNRSPTCSRCTSRPVITAGSLVFHVMSPRRTRSTFDITECGPLIRVSPHAVMVAPDDASVPRMAFDAPATRHAADAPEAHTTTSSPA